MAKVKLTYTEKGKNPRTEIFRCEGEANDHLKKLKAHLDIVSAKVKEIEKAESPLAYLGRTAGKHT